MTYTPPFDTLVNNWFFAMHSDFLTHFFIGIALFGNWALVLPLTLVLYVLLRHSLSLRTYGVPFLVTVATAEAMTFVLKLLIARPRPYGGLVPEYDYSFPSGHATLAAAFYGFLAYVAYQQIQNKTVRVIVVGTSIATILLIGLCRLYLGVHYLSDVIAGYMVGFLGILIGVSMCRHPFKPSS